MSARKVIDNVRIVNEGERFMGYVVIEDEIISSVGHGAAPESVKVGTQIVDGRERLLLPGCIDTHVHFREPGFTEKGNFASESRAAVAGGITSYIDMPNTRPATTSMELLNEKAKLASQFSLANYGFFIGATSSNLNELLKADYSRVAGVKLFMGSSTGDLFVDKADSIEEIFRQVKSVIAVHAEDEKLMRERRQAVIDRYGESLEMEFHPVIRNHDVCLRATRRAVELAHKYGSRLHVLHISTADELQFFSPGPVAGKRITAETCPQYLVFTDEHYAALGARIKCNPAIKREADREALRAAVAGGVIDTIATDHAPHLLEQKRGTALTAVSGMPMLQFALPVLMDMAADGIFTIEQIVEKYAHNPARIYNIDRRGFIREGYYADLVMVDDNCDPYTITDQWAVNKCGWTPFSGLTLNNRVETTWVNGTEAYRHGVIFSATRGKELRFS